MPRDRSNRRPTKAVKRTRTTKVGKPATARGAEAKSEKENDPQKNGVRVVGLGASAGGLEALDEFLRHVPMPCGNAFVVVQHLDPNTDGMLVDLLQRVTAMPVSQATNGARLSADHVYVIPPGSDLSLHRGVLYVLPQPTPRGLRMPIDYFFRTLAEDLGERAVGVVLSGTGSDGTAGLRAIRANAGVTFAQEPGSAKFDGMPRSAIDAGVADVVAPVAELPANILALPRRAISALRQRQAETALQRVCALLRAQTGTDFSLYKTSTILRRVERRMGLHQLADVEQYVRFLRENPREGSLLGKELLIGVTSFFRDAGAWDQLRDLVVEAKLASMPSGPGKKHLRAWVAGCSTGEEAYSLAIVFRECMDRYPGANLSLQIFATDLDRDAIDTARLGHYPRNIAADVSAERLKRWFVEDETGYRLSKGIREMVTFAPQNVAADPPFTRLDVLCCRNLLIYFSTTLQKKLIPLFHYALNPGGLLFLGNAESVAGFTTLFAAIEGAARIYRKVDHPLVSVPIDFPSLSPTARAGSDDTDRAGAERRAEPTNLQALVDRVLVKRFAPVSILCTETGDILYLTGRAGRYLEPAVGKANLNVFAMINEGLRHDLSSAFSKAVREPRVVTVRGVRLSTESGTERVDLTVQRVAEAEIRGTMMIVIHDVPRGPVVEKPVASPKGAPRRIAELEQELERARADVQTTREEMQTSQEELKSTNEELQSANEELQSTNEELTTSKEELQSLNEELQTLNEELRVSVDDLSHANNDMKNLLNSTDIATLFLDSGLRVRRFTTQTTNIIRLIPTDIGRPVTDLASELDYPGLADDAREVLRTLAVIERQAATRDGSWYLVRLLPYRTVDNGLDGVVITFTDATKQRTFELALRDQARQLQQLAASLPNLVWAFRPDGACDYLGPQWVTYTGVPERDQLGSRWLEQVDPTDRDRVAADWRAALELGRDFAAELRVKRADGATRWFAARVVPVRDVQGRLLRWCGTATDIDDIKQGRRGKADERSEGT